MELRSGTCYRRVCESSDSSFSVNRLSSIRRLSCSETACFSLISLTKEGLKPAGEAGGEITHKLSVQTFISIPQHRPLGRGGVKGAYERKGAPAAPYRSTRAGSGHANATHVTFIQVKKCLFALVSPGSVCTCVCATVKTAIHSQNPIVGICIQA